MSGLLAYCRPGFESDCAAELQNKTALLGSFGYCQTKANQGYVIYRCAAEEAEHLAKKLALNELIFTRQFIAILAEINDLLTKTGYLRYNLRCLMKVYKRYLAGSSLPVICGLKHRILTKVKS